MGFAYAQGQTSKRFLKIPLCLIIVFTNYDRILSNLRGRAKVNHFLPYPGKLLYCCTLVFLKIIMLYEIIYTCRTT